MVLEIVVIRLMIFRGPLPWANRLSVYLYKMNRCFIRMENSKLKDLIRELMADIKRVEPAFR